MSDPFRFPVRVHWPDTDPAGIVWFGHFFRYFEEAEEELFRALGRDRQDVIETLNIWMPRVEVACRFRAPARLGHLIHIAVGVAELAERRLTYEFQFTDGDVLLGEGSCRVACVDRDTFKGRAFPAEVRELLGRVPELPKREPR